MRWSRIKNIIILLLVVVNGFLLAQVGMLEWQSHRGQRETRERMIAILARNDVAYLPQEIPGELELTARRVVLSPFGESEAEVLVGTVSDVQTQGTQGVYRGAEGTVRVSSDGELTVEFTSGGALSEAAVLERLSKLGITLRETGRTQEGDTRVSYVQLWDGAPIPGQSALLVREAGYPRSLTLRFLAGSEEVLPAEETVSAATALTRLLDELSRGEGYVCSQITDMYPGYVASGTGTVSLAPAWFIETDTWRFVVDGRTGQVTATE